MPQAAKTETEAVSIDTTKCASLLRDLGWLVVAPPEVEALLGGRFTPASKPCPAQSSEERVRRAVVRILEARAEAMSWSEVRKAIASRDRHLLLGVMAALVLDGVLGTEEIDSRQGRGRVRYRLIGTDVRVTP